MALSAARHGPRTDGGPRLAGVDLQDAVIEGGSQPGQSHEGMADGAGERALAREAGQLRGEPGLEVIQDRLGLGLAQPDPLLGRQAPGGHLDGVEPGDPPDGFLGDG